jgi:hypothetical protein
MTKLDWEKIEKLLLTGLDKYRAEDLRVAIINFLRNQSKGLAGSKDEESLTHKLIDEVFRQMKKDLKIIKFKAPKQFETIKSEIALYRDMERKKREMTPEDWDLLMDKKGMLNQMKEDALGGDSESEIEESIAGELKKLQKQGKHNFNVRESWDYV